MGKLTYFSPRAIHWPNQLGLGHPASYLPPRPPSTHLHWTLELLGQVPQPFQASMQQQPSTTQEPGVDHPALPGGRTEAFHLGCFLRNEPSSHLEMWSGPSRALLVLCSLPPLPPTLQSRWFLPISSLQAFVLAKLRVECSSSILPCAAHTHP